MPRQCELLIHWFRQSRIEKEELRVKLRNILSVGTVLALPFCLFSAPSHAETRGYVIGWFSTATYNDFHANCPLDKNGGGLKLRLRNLMEIGYSEAEALDIINGVKNAPDSNKKINTRAVVNGKAMPVANFPEAVRDPMIETVVGKWAYGFDLGGTNAEAKFTDADTGEKIDNQLWRAVGCTESYRATPPEQPYPEELSWATLIDTAPGWSIYLTGDNLDRDGPVTITLDRVLQHLERDANGKAVIWAVEMAGSAASAQDGISVSSFKEGTVFSVGLHPQRTGEPSGFREGPLFKCPTGENGKAIPPKAGMHCDSVEGNSIFGKGTLPAPTK